MHKPSHLLLLTQIPLSYTPQIHNTMMTSFSSSKFIILTYPELLLSFSFFILFFLLHQLNRSSGGPHPNRLLPVAWPLLGHVPYLFVHFRRLHDFVTDTLRHSACSYFFIGPVGSHFSLLLTSDPANVNHVFNANFPNYPKGPHFALIFDFLGSGIFNSDDESWKFQRKKTHSLMSAPKFRAFVVESTSAKVEDHLLPLLAKFSEDGEVLDLQDVFMRLSFDATCTLVFGIDPGCLSPGFPTVPFAAAMDDAEEVALFRHVVPIPCWKMLRWMRVGPERKMADAVVVLDQFIHNYISLRKNEENRKNDGADLLTSYLDSEAEIVEAGFPDFDKFLRDTTLNLMVAGRDTTSSALTWFFYLISKHPEAESKILEELRSLREEEKSAAYSYSKLGKMVYLHAALFESLRLYPPVPFEHKGAVKAETLPSGARVDENTMLMFSLYSMGRMEGVWGKDCTEFKPERWISAESGKVGHVPSYKFLSFNAGPRTCLGKDIALTQLKVVAAAVLERFRVRAVEGFVAKPKLSIILHMKEGLKVRVSKRKD